MERPQEDIDLNVKWREACEEFARTTGERLDQKARPEHVVARIQARKERDDKDSARLKRFASVIDKTIICLRSVGGALSQAASMFFGPTDMCINAVSFFVQAAMNYRKIFSGLDDLWFSISEALNRFTIYKDNHNLLDYAMKKVASDILLQFIDICKLSCKLIRENTGLRMLKVTLFKDDGGVPDAIDQLMKIVDRETKLSGALTYVTAKSTAKGVGEISVKVDQGFAQTIERLEQSDQRMAALVNQNDRKRQLDSVRKRLRQPDNSQTEIYENAIPNTGNWLLQHDYFQSWVKDTKEQPGILFLSGEQDCGKTFLILKVMQNLKTEFPQGKEDMSRVSVAYYSFKRPEASRKETNTLPSRDQNSVHAGLRSLAYQVAENDPIYRKNIDQENSEYFASDIVDLWTLLFGQQDDGVRIYILIDGLHELDDRQQSDLGRVLGSLKSPSISVMAAGRSEIIRPLSNELGSRALNIDVATANSEDIELYVRHEVHSMALLRGSPSLRQEIRESLIEIARGTYGNIGLLLQQVRTKRRPNEIRDLLQDAQKNSSILDTIARQIEDCNQKLDDADIDDLNQLLEWVISSDSPYTIQELEGVLNIRKEGGSDSLSFEPLQNRLQRDFSGFFSLSSDEPEPQTEVSLVSDKVKEYFENLSASEPDESKGSSKKISKMEVDIIQRFLKTICDDSLYEKFEFEQFFKQKAGAASKVHVNMEEMKASVALDCIRVALEETENTGTIKWQASVQLLDRLQEADLSYLNPKLKAEIGRRLVSIFTGKKEFRPWDYFCAFDYVANEQFEDTIMKWIRDTAAMKDVPEDQKAWVDTMKKAADSERDILGNIAKTAAHQWLFGKPGGELELWNVNYAFRFLRGYLRMMKQKKDPTKEVFTVDDYWSSDSDVDIIGPLDWAIKQTKVLNFTYINLLRLAETFREFEQHDEALERLQQAIELQKDDANEARSRMATIYADHANFKLAIETLAQVVNTQRRLSKDSEEKARELNENLNEIASWKKELGLYGEAMQMYQEMLDKDTKNYEVIGNILSLLADQNHLQQIIDYLDDLESQTDAETGNDRLTQLLLDRAYSRDVHDTISRSTMELSSTDTIHDSYKKAIRAAEKKKADGEKEQIVIIVQLKQYLADSLYRQSNGATISRSAVELWEEVVKLQRPRERSWEVYRTRRTATSSLFLHYLAEARALGVDSESAQGPIRKVRDIVEGFSKEQTVLLRDDEIKVMLGYHFAASGQWQKARENLHSIIELGIGLLSDEDKTNDHTGFIKLADGFMRLKDDDNAHAAWSLLGPRKHLPPEPATDGPSQQKNDLEPTVPIIHTSSMNDQNLPEGSGTNIPAPTDSALDPDNLSLRPPLKRAPTTLAPKQPEGPLAYYCDCQTSSCKSRFTFANDFWWCRQCICVQFTTSCLESLRQGKLRRQVCDKTHDFFHIPPWDYEKARRLGKDNVQVGDKVMTVEEWLDNIRRDWGIKSRKDEGDGEGEGEKGVSTTADRS